MADLGLIALLEFTDRLGRLRKQLLVDFLLPIRCAMIHARVRVQNHRQPPPARQHLHGGVMEMVMELSWNCHGIVMESLFVESSRSRCSPTGAALVPNTASLAQNAKSTHTALDECCIHALRHSKNRMDDAPTIPTAALAEASAAAVAAPQTENTSGTEALECSKMRLKTFCARLGACKLLAIVRCVRRV